MSRVTEPISDEDLVARYRAGASEHGKSTESGDYKAGNKAADRVAAAYRTLRERGLSSQLKLLPLLRDPETGVRGWAGAHALEFAPDQGELVLTQLASQRGLIAFSAKMTLQEWRAGRLRFP